MKFTLITLLLFFTSFHLQAQNNKANRPNIIIIFMDDMGYGDLGVTGALDYSTPNLDKMAESGIRFTNFLVPQAVCSASRAALLTGNYPNRMGVHGAYMPNAGRGLNPSEITIAEMLRAKGYRTYMIGKWHLGNEPDFLPTKQGFEGYFGLPYSNDMWPVDFDGKPAKPGSNLSKYPVLPLLKIKEGQQFPDTIQKINTLEDQGTLTQQYTDHAISFIKTNRKEPFFLYLAHSMSHVPIAASKNFQGKSKQGLYGDIMQEIDWSVGQLVETLEKQGILKNTLIIFTSDNGPWLNFGNHNGSAGGFREGKGTSWEGGTRVPCIISWPSQIKTGRINNNLNSSIDIFPTLSKIVGYADDSFQVDGISFLSNIQDVNARPTRDRLYYYYNKNDLEAVRYENWKLVFPHQSRSYDHILPGNNGLPGKYNILTIKTLELYDLRRDPGEQYNVIDLYPEITDKLLKIADEARNDLGDDLQQVPGKNRRPSGTLSKIK